MFVLRLSLCLSLLMPPGEVERQAGAPEPADTGEDAVVVGESGLIDVRFRDAHVFDALEMLSEKAQRNVVVANGVSGTISVALRKVTFDEALRAILAAADLTFEPRGNAIFVTAVKKDAAPQEPAVARLFRLKYIAAGEAMAFLKPLLDERCNLTRTTDPQQGIGSDKKSAGGFSSAGADVLLLLAPKEKVELVAAILNDIDVRPQQVLVEATIMRATLSDGNALGIDFNTLGGVDFQSLGAVSPEVRSISGGTVPQHRLDDSNFTIRTDFKDAVPTGGFTFGIVKDQVAAFIRALEQVTDVSIMANPKVLTLNKQRGEVIVGRRDGYVTTTVTETAAVQSVEYLETGTKLIFRPFIAGDGYVRMEVHPEDSNGGLTAANLPFQETTEATTNIMLKDGHTILIGGLFRERSTAGRTQVPLVGNIPVVGKFFGVTQDQTTREEVIILLTVHVLTGDEKETTAFESLKDDIERLRIGARRGLMGTGREQLAESRYRAAVEALRRGEIDRAISNAEMTLQLHPRHMEAIRLRERLTAERSWNAEGSVMRSFVTELLRSEAGLPPRPVFDEPDVDGMLERGRDEK
ncbi:Type IV pilus biogenesis and competence protein PilQ precursor [Phycisphaerae bacterium RAS1]|nr:Type IV pilus biogenesis and competence protein PilQ precursor [Phycisphaerae bacterium RAS1]